MTETGFPALPGNVLPLTDAGEAARVNSLEAVQALDPELLENPDARQLIEMGAQFVGETTDRYGTPDHPLWHEGTVENRPMTYHNGGEDGHTSAGEHGIGVPRGALLIAGAVNRAAGREVFDPVARATSFYAGAAHDLDQNCGRALLPEGQQGEDYGDERLSAEAARDRLLAAADAQESPVDPALANQAYLEVMATAFDPNTKAQKISYDALEADPENPDLQQSILGQELLAAADLLSPTSPRGTLGAIENVLEGLASNASGRALQQALEARGIPLTGTVEVGQILDVIGEDEELRTQFTNSMNGQANFFGGFQYSDREIRKVTGGQGIDDLFPGRAENAAVLTGFTEALRNGTASPRDVWQQARVRAGYQD